MDKNNILEYKMCIRIERKARGSLKNHNMIAKGGHCTALPATTWGKGQKPSCTQFLGLARPYP